MSGAWRGLVDDRYPSERSLLLRYWRALDLAGVPRIGPAQLEAVSVAEGARVVPLGEHRGVEILVCDESTLMASGTYKDLDACLTVTLLECEGVGRVVTSSGGNLGHALARYCRARGIELLSFQPHSTRYKLNAAPPAADGVHIVSAALPEPQIKALARRFGERFGVRHVPALPWRLAASATRAMFILEAAQASAQPVRWIAQAVCAGYGPVGIYRCLGRLVDRGWLHPDRVPRLLGIQQRANAPMVRAWRDGARRIDPRHRQNLERRGVEHRYLEPGLYNTDPGANYTRLVRCLERFGGELLGVDADDYQRHCERLISWLGAAGITLTRDPGSGEILEKAGLLAGVGILRAVERGLIAPGERALYLFTGGARRLRPAARAPHQPIEIDDSHDLETWVELLGQRLLPGPVVHPQPQAEA